MECRVGSRVVAIKEPTLKEIRQYFKDVTARAETSNFDMVGESLLGDGRSLDDLYWLTDLTRAEAEELKPSELFAVLNAVEKENPLFFAQRRRLAQVGAAILAANSKVQTSV